tara:strand:+ start:172 stop:420 length:249 start_codon:yes stop_codon:yes gene_type:complete
MHNIKEIRKNLDFFKKKISERNSLINFDDLIVLDKENRKLIQEKEKKEQKKKLYLSQKILQILKILKNYLQKFMKLKKNKLS